eukprot:scaffold89232_cov75-Phaeocystis_antarctica.AAC.2
MSFHAERAKNRARKPEMNCFGATKRRTIRRTIRRSHEMMVENALPLATPELRPKALTRACPDNLDLFSLEQLTPEVCAKRASPKVNTAP